jgi:tetratricopeptide (TPR) repeat protein
MKSPGALRLDCPATTVEPELVRTQLERILASPKFVTAKHACRFLRYVVEETLAGRSDQLKEYVVGVAVFERGNEYDPRTDAVVRVEAIRLRNRLRDYYQSDGRGDTVAIELAKGSYVPVFRWLPELPPIEKVRFDDVRRVSQEAIDYYLRGRFCSQYQSKDENETAILNLERAVGIDPNFASAYAELAQAYVWRLFLFAPEERQWEEKAFMASERALSLDPDLPAAHIARGRLLWTPANHFPHEKAIREYRRALASDPTLDEPRNQLALIYCHIGFFDEALKEAQEAVLRNPTNNLAVYRTAQTLAFRGEYKEALLVLSGIPPGINQSLVGYQTAWVLFNLGKTEEAAAKIAQLLNECSQDEGGLFTSVQAVLAASVGDERTSEARIESAVEKGRGFGHFHHTAYHIAAAYALMKNSEQAIQWLEAAATDGFPCYPLFESDPNLDNIRGDTHFVASMAQLRQQWLSYKTLF